MTSVVGGVINDYDLDVCRVRTFNDGREATNQKISGVVADNNYRNLWRRVHPRRIWHQRDMVNLADPAALNYILTGHIGNQKLQKIPK